MTKCTWRPSEWKPGMRFLRLPGSSGNSKNTERDDRSSFSVTRRLSGLAMSTDVNRSNVTQDCSGSARARATYGFANVETSPAISRRATQKQECDSSTARNDRATVCQLTADITGHGELTFHREERRKPCSRACHCSAFCGLTLTWSRGP